MVLNRAVRGLTTITLVFEGLNLEGGFVFANKREVRCLVVKFIKVRSEIVGK